MQLQGMALSRQLAHMQVRNAAMQPPSPCNPSGQQRTASTKQASSSRHSMGIGIVVCSTMHGVRPFKQTCGHLHCAKCCRVGVGRRRLPTVCSWGSRRHGSPRLQASTGRSPTVCSCAQLVGLVKSSELPFSFSCSPHGGLPVHLCGVGAKSPSVVLGQRSPRAKALG